MLVAPMKEIQALGLAVQARAVRGEMTMMRTVMLVSHARDLAHSLAKKTNGIHEMLEKLDGEARMTAITKITPDTAVPGTSHANGRLHLHQTKEDVKIVGKRHLTQEALDGRLMRLTLTLAFHGQTMIVGQTIDKDLLGIETIARTDRTNGLLTHGRTTTKASGKWQRQ